MTTDANRARGRYKSGDARRESILAAAYEHFARYGYHGASLRDIAAAAGISHAGLRHHFATKEGLLLAVLEERERRAVEASAGRVGVDSLVDLVAHNISTRGLVELFAVLAPQAAHEDHPAHEFFVERYRRVRDLIATHIHAAQGSGAMPGVDAQAAASLIVALMDGIQVQWLIEPENTDMRRLLEAGVRAVLAPLRAGEISEHSGLTQPSTNRRA